MGNAEAKPKEHLKPANNTLSKVIDKRSEQAFVKLVGSTSNTLTFGHLKNIFGKDVAESLWRYLSDSKSDDAELSFQEFARHAASLMGISTDIYITVFQPVLHLIKVCSEAAGAGAVSGDEQFIGNLANEMCAGGSNAQAITSWKNSLCPKFCHALQGRIFQAFLGIGCPLADYSSDILTPLQMWYIHCSLPSKYFVTEPTKKSSNASLISNMTHWTPLYLTSTQGISVNRFETNVFDYKGPTVSIFQLSDNSIFVLATEETWRHGSSRFGGPDTVLFQVAPKLSRWESSASIYCNFKIRSAVFGLSFKDVLKIEKDMSNVEAIEIYVYAKNDYHNVLHALMPMCAAARMASYVTYLSISSIFFHVWGCAASSALEDQQKLKAWQNKQAEKNRKVPLPGNWDDNPDKTLLEMGGFQFSDERRRMELESKH